MSLLCAAIGLWLSVVTAGFFLLAVEQYTPATTGQVATALLRGTSPKVSCPTLLLFVHPQCPCTRATLVELDELLASVHDKVQVTIYFVVPPGTPTGWEKGDLWNQAHRLTGVHVVTDLDGKIAARCGVRTSGHALLYSSTGDLVFSGGITFARGHEGDNAGEWSIADYLRSGHIPVNRTPVFGCSLL